MASPWRSYIESEIPDSSTPRDLFPPEDDRTIPTLTPVQLASLGLSSSPTAEQLAAVTALQRWGRTRITWRFRSPTVTTTTTSMSSSTRPTSATSGSAPEVTGGVTVRLGGFECHIPQADSNKAADITQENGCLYALKERPDPSEKEYRKITEYCTQKGHFEPKFSRNTACLNDIKSLTNVNDLHNQISQLKAVLKTIDLKQIFNVLFPIDMSVNAQLKQDSTGTYVSVDLLANHGTVTAEQVGESSMYWKKFLFYEDKGGNQRSFQNEHSQTYHLVLNHMDSNLRDAVVREYNTYNSDWHGGPLLFWVMMQHLMAGNETAMQTLITTVGKFNIATDAKDDVRYAISVLRAASGAIVSMRVNPKASVYPPTFVEKNIKVLQTTSCPLFNDKMGLLQKDAEHQRKLGGTPVITNDEAGLNIALNYASTTLSDLERDGTWTSSLSPEKGESAFAATNNPCFNCGTPGCIPKRCSIPVDKARVKANREKYNAEKKKTGKKKPRPHQWRLPEPHENGMRTQSDGKVYKWNDTKKYWEEVEAPESGIQSPPTGLSATAEASAVPVDDTDAMTKIQRDMANLLNNQVEIKNAVV